METTTQQQMCYRLGTLKRNFQTVSASSTAVLQWLQALALRFFPSPAGIQRSTAERFHQSDVREAEGLIVAPPPWRKKLKVVGPAQERKQTNRTDGPLVEAKKNRKMDPLKKGDHQSCSQGCRRFGKLRFEVNLIELLKGSFRSMPLDKSTDNKNFPHNLG